MSKFEICEYCVIYVDLMGQKLFLHDLEKSKKEDAQRKINELSTPLLEFKNGVNKRVNEVLDDLKRIIMNKDEFNGNALLKSIDDVRVGVQQFSDTTMLYVKMGSPVSFLVLLFLIEFIAFRTLTDISNGLILRGGIAVGKGWEVERNCLCGSVISEAYNLESKVSNWGRITVSEVLLTRLNAFCDLARECNGWWVLALLNPLLQIINKDIDGVLFLDYLNPAVSELYRIEHFGSDWFEECCEKGYKYIINQAEYYQTNANKDYEYSRLALRYKIMLQYWKSRLEMWSLK